MIERVQWVVALILSIEHTPHHHRVEAAQRGNQQVQAVRADRRAVGGLDEPALDTARSERTASLQQEQPGVLANRLRSSVPLIAMLGQKPNQGRSTARYVSRVRAAPV